MRGLRVTNTGLVLRSKSADSAGDCWYVVEDDIMFNDQINDMPVRSRVLDGSSRCDSVGRVSKLTLQRME